MKPRRRAPRKQERQRRTLPIQVRWKRYVRTQMRWVRPPQTQMQPRRRSPRKAGRPRNSLSQTTQGHTGLSQCHWAQQKVQGPSLSSRDAEVHRKTKAGSKTLVEPVTMIFNFHAARPLSMLAPPLPDHWRTSLPPHPMTNVNSKPHTPRSDTSYLQNAPSHHLSL